MTTLRDLVLEVQQGAVVEEIARFYDQRETQWLPDAVADVLGQLQNLAPDLAGSPYQLSIELTPPAIPRISRSGMSAAPKKMIPTAAA